MSKNEAIAQWMGWTNFIDQMGVTHAVPPYAGGGKLKETLPTYDESLDALVPVMEALRNKHNIRVDLGVSGVGFWASAEFEDESWQEMDFATSASEAAANAIYAALVAMGEVEDD